MSKFKVGDRVKVIGVNISNKEYVGECGVIKEIDTTYKYPYCVYVGGKLIWSTILEDKMSKYEELKSRIEAVEGWTKEADDILIEIQKKFDGRVEVNISQDIWDDTDRYPCASINVHTSLCGEDDQRFSFSSQCDKNRKFKKALLWLLDHSDITKKSEQEQKIDELQEQIDKLREEL